MSHFKYIDRRATVPNFFLKIPLSRGGSAPAFSMWFIGCRKCIHIPYDISIRSAVFRLSMARDCDQQTDTETDYVSPSVGIDRIYDVHASCDAA